MRLEYIFGAINKKKPHVNVFASASTIRKPELLHPYLWSSIPSRPRSLQRRMVQSFQKCTDQSRIGAMVVKPAIGINTVDPAIAEKGGQQLQANGYPVCLGIDRTWRFRRRRQPTIQIQQAFHKIEDTPQPQQSDGLSSVRPQGHRQSRCAHLSE